TRTPRAASAGCSRRETTVTVRPAASSRSTRCEPRKPAPPVTRTGPPVIVRLSVITNQGLGFPGHGASAFGIGFEAVMAAGPTSQREAVDLGVVAHINRQARVEIEGFDAFGVRVGFAELAEGAGEPTAIGAGVAVNTRDRLDDNRGALPAALTDADQGAAADVGVGVKMGFDLLGIEHALGRGHAFGEPAAKPEASLGVEPAGVAHAVPDVGAVGDLGRGGGL